MDGGPSVIEELRANLIADLVTGSGGEATPIGCKVLAAWPDKAPTPPVAFVIPPQGTPYVTTGPTFGTYTVAFDIVLVTGRSGARDALAQLEAFLERVLANTADWRLSGVDSPSIVTINGIDYLGSTAHLSHSASI